MNHQVYETQVDLKTYQMQKLNELLVFVTGFNEFYKEKFKGIHLPITTLKDLSNLPFTTKKELSGSNHSIMILTMISGNQEIFVRI